MWVIDTRSAQVVGFIEFEKTVDEIFDIQVLPGIRHPAVIGSLSKAFTADDIRAWRERIGKLLPEELQVADLGPLFGPPTGDQAADPLTYTLEPKLDGL